MDRRIYKSIKTILLCISILSMFLLTGAADLEDQAATRQTKTIRVGYPIQEGLSMKDENGNLYGYTYDYIMEISQYIGWNYEFVFYEGDINTQLVESMEMLKAGEIDLLGALYYDEALTADYAYPGYCYGINYSGLFVSEDSRLRESTLYNTETIKVGVHNKAGNKNSRLEQFAQMNNLDIEQVISPTKEDYNRMLEDGRADALLSTDLAMAAKEGMYAISHFAPEPFYFATTKGNTEIVQQLDHALSTIDQVNPNFMSQLYNEYFSQMPTSISLTKEEMDFIASCGPLEVVMYDNKPPFQSVDSKTGEPVGITVEVLDYIAQSMNLTFNYNTVSSYDDYIAYMESGKADIAADVFSNYQDALDTKSALTLPWYSLPITMVFKEGAEFTGTDRLAVPYFLKNVIDSTADVMFYDTVEECFKAVQKGNADYGFMGEFCSQYYFNRTEYSDLKRINQAEISNQKLCFGIYDTLSPSLHTIFNKGITALPKDMVSEIIYRNTYQQQELTITELIKKNRNLIIAVATTLLAVFLTVCFYIKNRQQKRVSFENKRYNAISNLANEYFYEYDVFGDELNLSEKCADYFSCQQTISSFSKQLLNMPDVENKGIWQMGEYIISSKEGSFEVPCLMHDDTKQWFEIFSSVIYNNKNQSFFVGKITNIQEIKSEQILLKRQASLDGLTGIYNISTFKREISTWFTQFDTYAPCALIILDIDNFKQLNDSFGHYNGDIVLSNIARLISETITNGLHGRLGGDEFVVFAVNTDKGTIEEQCRTICDAMVKETESLLGTSFSISIGITWAQKGQTYEELYKKADAALYQTKATSKNSHTFYESGS